MLGGTVDDVTRNWFFRFESQSAEKMVGALQFDVQLREILGNVNHERKITQPLGITEFLDRCSLHLHELFDFTQFIKMHKHVPTTRPPHFTTINKITVLQIKIIQ
ncbi:hypothetical protein Pcinc_015716 [Petrolisthes cinctipes]|uniref:Uncharacterized protein n=1 Tax=Petrolisthes cinctipes TaxID=88211 RepID=A0AAE1KQF2_PETCI|nr:hypothetical protein Pcinc_015716 [Petrolisthes cinctipes]